MHPSSREVSLRGPSLAWGAIGGGITLLLVATALWRLGWPLNPYTWGVIALCALSGVTLRRPKQNLGWFVLALSVCLYLNFPRECQVIPVINVWSLYDDVGSRSGSAITPFLHFGRDGENTKLMESYVGPLEANWWYQCPLSPYMRDGNERVRSRSITRYGYFPELLAMLPDDQARRTVILALTDRSNRLRVHQGLLLACLYVGNYPEGMDAESWWAHHQALFEPEYDPTVAAAVIQGWRAQAERLESRDVDSIIYLQLYATGYQEEGGWGGDEELGEVALDIEYGGREPDPDGLARGQQVIWWPDEAQED